MTLLLPKTIPSLKKVPFDGLCVPVRYTEAEIKPKELTIESFPPPLERILPVYHATNIVGSLCEPKDWSHPVYEILQHELSNAGGVLLRGLPLLDIDSYTQFFEEFLRIAPKEEWSIVEYEPFGGPRPKIGKYDKPAGTHGLLHHSDMCYNPSFPKYISAYCLQDAKVGGETIILRNDELVQALPNEMVNLVRQLGVSQTRKYGDMTDSNWNQRTDTFMSWQERCRLQPGESREAAEKFWLDLGFSSDDIKWDKDESLIISNNTPGIIKDGRGVEYWFNLLISYNVAEDDIALDPEHLGTFSVLGNGDPLEPEFLSVLKQKAMECSYGFQMVPGDWLILDNIQFAHARQMYEHGEKPRTIIVTLFNSQNPKSYGLL
eukprot:TRINITY_DN865_c0_g1_i1.p1 TRINITY_DN865_c0_g1~~TRINITY_DN865_c0_g1_i1.p1  ORF type:complete len:376 (+),score=26.48 TRINITY_DN865_c0_g1_i1:163-1290(+)